MPADISPFDFLHLIMHRLGALIMWLAFAVFHLGLAVAALAALWFWQVSPADAAQGASAAFQRFHGATLLAVAGTLGVSGAALLWGYVTLWRRGYAKVVTPYLFQDVDRVTAA